MSDDRILHQGRVVDRRGAGSGQALVYVAGGTAKTPEIAVRCDDAGRFRMALPPGHFRIEARSVRGTVGTVEMEVKGNDDEIAIIIDE
jgi:hypothetical protein